MQSCPAPQKRPVSQALAFGYGARLALRRYLADARRDLLVKYWALWTPVQCLTFGVVPPQWRVPFIALVSFFWLLVLSSISSRGDLAAPPAPAADPQTTRTMGGE